MNKKNATRNSVEKSLLDELKEKHVESGYLYDIVEKYMNLWDVHEKLNEDINERGVTIKYPYGDSFGYKKNDSVSELIKIKAQMTKELQAFHNILEKIKIEDEDEEM